MTNHSEFENLFLKGDKLVEGSHNNSSLTFHGLHGRCEMKWEFISLEMSSHFLFVSTL